MDRHRHRFSELGDHPGREASLDDQVEVVGRISSMEDNLAAVEPASPTDSDEPAKLSLGQAAEERTLDHGRTVTVVTRRVSSL